MVAEILLLWTWGVRWIHRRTRMAQPRPDSTSADYDMTYSSSRSRSTGSPGLDSALNDKEHNLSERYPPSESHSLLARGRSMYRLQPTISTEGKIPKALERRTEELHVCSEWRRNQEGENKMNIKKYLRCAVLQPLLPFLKALPASPAAHPLAGFRGVVGSSAPRGAVPPPQARAARLSGRLGRPGFLLAVLARHAGSAPPGRVLALRAPLRRCRRCSDISIIIISCCCRGQGAVDGRPLALLVAAFALVGRSAASARWGRVLQRWSRFGRFGKAGRDGNTPNSLDVPFLSNPLLTCRRGREGGTRPFLPRKQPAKNSRRRQIHLIWCTTRTKRSLERECLLGRLCFGFRNPLYSETNRNSSHFRMEFLISADLVLAEALEIFGDLDPLTTRWDASGISLSRVRNMRRDPHTHQREAFRAETPPTEM